MVTAEDDNVASLMSSADVACYSAKDMGRNQVHLYKDSDASLRHEEMKWVSRITSAVDQERFELFYQPMMLPMRSIFSAGTPSAIRFSSASSDE